jgi:hypothetical protein
MNYLVIISFLLFSGYSHPVHISVTNIEYDANNEKFIIAFKVFSDDLESVINKKYKINLNLGKENELTNSSDYLTQYMQEHFRFYINTKKNLSEDLIFVKKEMNFEATWIYYELKFNGVVKKSIIRNSMLDDLYPDQKNLVMFNYKDVNKGFQFRKNDNAEIIEL